MRAWGLQRLLGLQGAREAAATVRGCSDCEGHLGRCSDCEGLRRCSDDCEGQLAWAAGRPRGCSDWPGDGGALGCSVRAAATVRPLAGFGSRPAIEVPQLSHGQGHRPPGEPGHGLGAAPGHGQGRLPISHTQPTNDDSASKRAQFDQKLASWARRRAASFIRRNYRLPALENHIMSSWAQQREAIRRAAQGGVRARTNVQGSQRLPLANNRLREVLLSRPNGESSTTASWEVPSRQFDEEQPLIREGPIKKPGPTAATTSPRPTRSSCATRGSATPSPTPAARGSRCGAGCTCATPPARTSQTHPPSPKRMGPKPRHSHPPGGGLWGTDCPFFAPGTGQIAGMGEGRKSAHGDQLREKWVVGVAEPLHSREALAVVQQKPLPDLPDLDEAAFGHLSACSSTTASRASRLFLLVDGDPVSVGDHQARVRPHASNSCARCTASRSSTCSASPRSHSKKGKIFWSLRWFSVSSCRKPPARSGAVATRACGAPAPAEGVLHRGQLPEVAEQ